MNRDLQIYELLKKQKGANLSELANQAGVSPDFVSGVIEGDKRYSLNGEFVSLVGLGVNVCIVCGEDNMEKHNSAKIKIPEEKIPRRRLDSRIYTGIRGHMKCYSTIDVFFRDERLRCFSCSSWSGGWIDGDEVLEKCHTWEYEYAGGQGVVGRNKVCNFFRPGYTNPNLESESYRKEIESENAALKRKWEQIKSEFDNRTERGYSNLISILEKARLIR